MVLRKKNLYRGFQISRQLRKSEVAVFFPLALSSLFQVSHICSYPCLFFIIIIDDEAGFLFLLSSLFMRNGKWA